MQYWNVWIISNISLASSSNLLLFRTNASLTTSQNLVQSLKDEVTKIRTEKDTLQKELNAKVADIQEKVKTITQVKKIGRRYKTQYEELKAQHDKVDRISWQMKKKCILKSMFSSRVTYNLANGLHVPLV